MAKYKLGDKVSLKPEFITIENSPIGLFNTVKENKKVVISQIQETSFGEFVYCVKTEDNKVFCGFTEDVFVHD